MNLTSKRLLGVLLSLAALSAAACTSAPPADDTSSLIQEIADKDAKIEELESRLEAAQSKEEDEQPLESNLAQSSSSDLQELVSSTPDTTVSNPPNPASQPAAAPLAAPATSSAASEGSRSPTETVRSRFRAIGLTFHQESTAKEDEWIQKVLDDYTKNGVAVNSTTVQYIQKTSERSFTIVYPGTASSVPAPAASQPSTSNQSTGIYAKPYDPDAIIADLWVQAEAMGFYLDTSRQKDNSGWFSPIDTRYTNDLKSSFDYMLQTEAERFIGEMNIVAVSVGDGEYEFYFFR